VKAYNYECSCGEICDRIVLKNGESIFCPECKKPMIKVGGPIGGINILPLGIFDEDKFVKFTLGAKMVDGKKVGGKKIETIKEMKAAYNEQMGVKAKPVPVEPKKVVVRKRRTKAEMDADAKSV